MTLVLAVFVSAAPLTLEADPNHSTVGFSVKHMVVTTVRGQFTRFSSTVELDQDDPARSSVELKVDPASINTNNEKRDGHLRSPDFFDVQKCPQMSFRSSRIDKSGGKYKVIGDLTMHCVTKPVTLEVTFADQPIRSPMGTSVYPASAAAKLKRSEWGLTWNKPLEAGGVVVSDEVNLDLDFEYLPKKAEGKKDAPAATSARQ